MRMQINARQEKKKDEKKANKNPKRIPVEFHSKAKRVKGKREASRS